MYRHIDRAREEADVHAAAVFGEITQTISGQTADGTEMRVHLINGKPVGSHAIFHFTLNEEVNDLEASEPQVKSTKRRISMDEDV